MAPSWDDIVNDRNSVSIEYRTAFNDVSVTPWRFWGVETSGLTEEFFESIDDAIRLIERYYGPIKHTGFSDNLYTFESDESFQIRFITLNTKYVSAENYIENHYSDPYDDYAAEDHYSDPFDDYAARKEYKKSKENPWQTDFEKELE